MAILLGIILLPAALLGLALNAIPLGIKIVFAIIHHLFGGDSH